MKTKSFSVFPRLGGRSLDWGGEDRIIPESIGTWTSIGYQKIAFRTHQWGVRRRTGKGQSLTKRGSRNRQTPITDRHSRWNATAFL